jgi:hypothetical protein
MKRTIFFLILIITSTQFTFAQLPPIITSWVINTDSATGYDGIETNVQIVQYTDSNVYISATCIPGYDIGPWKGNPNVPKDQDFVYKLTRFPREYTAATPNTIGMGHIGVWTNGVSIFNPESANSYNNQGLWNQNAFYFEGAGFDSCLGHPDMTGEYHNHLNPKCLYNDADSTHHSPLIGFAFDGYPVYGAYGYASPLDSTSGIKRMKSSYELRKMVNRDTLPSGHVVPVDSDGPAVSGTYFLGYYTEDYEYVSGLGDLDSHNGRYCITPDYPNGTYAYFVTIDSTLTSTYPYVLGLTYYGVVQSGNTGPGSGHNTISDSTTVYSPTTGIAQVGSKPIKFTFTPNPVSDYAYIYFDPSSTNNIRGSIYNVKGELMQTIQNLQPSISYALNLTAYPSGVYFLHLTAGDEEVVQKIVKVK